MIEQTKRPNTWNEWFDITPAQIKQTSETLGVSTVTTISAELFPCTSILPGPGSYGNTLCICSEGVSSLEIYCNSTKRGRFRGSVGRGFTCLVPSETLFEAMWDQPASMAMVQFPKSGWEQQIAAFTKGDPALVTLDLELGLTDPLIQQLMFALQQETEDGAPFGVLYSDALGNALAIHLLRHYSNARLLSSRWKSRFNSAQRQLLEEYIDAYLSQNITLPELANLFQFSVLHFKRLFRTTYGIAPYRYVLHQRVERAKELLHHGSQKSLHDIAGMCGFANQSHFSRHFKEIVGVSPGHFRRHGM